MKNLSLYLAILLIVFVNACVEDNQQTLVTYEKEHDDDDDDDCGVFSDYNKLFESLVSKKTLKSHLRTYTRSIHLAGSKANLKLAKFTKERMESYGHESKLDSFKARLNRPKKRTLFAIDVNKRSKIIYEASLSEDILKFDPASFNSYRNETFFGYGSSGSASGQIIYANYGLPEDFEFLKANNIDLKNKIVLVRFGKCFRGLKIKNAEDYGAAGVIIYSDPMDDGFKLGKDYENFGVWRPKTSVQRGSVAFTSLCPGGVFRAYMKKSNAVFEQCGFKDDELIPNIPAIPISYGDALGIFALMNKTNQLVQTPKNFIGGLSIDYSIVGPSHILMNLTAMHEYKDYQLQNVITTIKGKDYGKPNGKFVLISNHYDAWTKGAADPNSGSTITLEIGRVLGILIKKHKLKLKHSIVIASWDGEEYGMIGSTMFAETYEKTIKQNLLAVLNVDVGVSGPLFQVSSSASLIKGLVSVIKDIKEPDSNKKSIFDTWDKDVIALGSGSDFVSFLNYNNIPSMDLRYTPDVKGAQYGTYHSIYDSFTYVAGVIDPTFKYHAKLTTIIGRLALDFANLEVVPIELSMLAKSLIKNVKFFDQQKGLNKEAKDKLFKLKVECDRLLSISNTVLKDLLKNKQYKTYNAIVSQAEKFFRIESGILYRKFYKSLLQAPGLNLGYGAEVFPGLVQAMRENNQQLIIEQIDLLIFSVENLNNFCTITTNTSTSTNNVIKSFESPN